jgi:putative flippase GtrA
MSTYSDYQIAFLLGIGVGVFLIPTLIVAGAPIFLAPLGIVIAPPVFALGIWIGRVFESALGFGGRFSKYAAAGLLSFSIDFGILNIVSAITGVTGGSSVGWVNIPGFCIAAVNAYVWNRIWVFPKTVEEKIFARFLHFLFVGIVGLTLNSTIVVLLTTYTAHPVILTDHQWLNIAKIIASGIAILWNFFGYKKIAFRPPTL